MIQGHSQPIRYTPSTHTSPIIIPSIAQLVERWTVVVQSQISIGRWFKSGSKEFLSVWETNAKYRMSFDLRYFHLFLDSLVVRISACHVEGPGSIPGRGEHFLAFPFWSWGHKNLAPGEARTHNPGISPRTVYKYRALTDCATGANC